MSFIKSRKKIVSSAIASSLSMIAVNAVAEEKVVQLETIHQEIAAEKQQSLKVDNSANKKFVAPLLDTPKSVSVISKQMIEDTQVTTLADALRTVPGITLGAGEGGNPNGDRPFIRGYNSESSMYVDGIRSATSQNREMFAVEQVEVTKGSASAMGGAGTTGGSINMISKVAKAGDSLEGSVAGGTDNYQRINLDGNKDFGNGIAARVAVMGHHNEKAGQKDGTEYKRAGIAPSITFGLDTPTRATLSYYYLKTDDTPDSGVPYNNPFGAPAAGATDNRPLNGNGKPINVKQGVYYGWEDRDFQKQENQIGTIKLEHDLTDNLTISNTASYSKSKNDYLWTNPDDSKGNIYLNNSVFARANSRVADTDTFTDQLALTGKFNTGSLQHSFNLGAEYSDQENDRTQYIINGLNATGSAYQTCPDSAPAGWCTPVQNPNRGPWTGTISTEGADQYNTRTKSTSIYFLDSIEFNPQWILDLGLRWDKFDTEQTMTYGANNAATKPTTVDGVVIPPKKNVGDQNTVTSDTDFFTYQAGVTFKPVENGSIYASYATSANPVGVDAGDGSEGIGEAYSNLDPEESRTFEVGTKWDLFDDRLNLTAAIFRTEKQNARIQLDSTTYANIGESKVDGFELGLNGNITDKWAASLGYTYLDSEQTDPGPSCTRAGVCTYPNAAKGKRLPNVPENSATLWTTYDLTPAFTVGAGAVAMDKVYGNADNTRYVPGYVRYDAMARYNVNQNVDLQLNVNNLTDQRYFTKAYASHYATEAEGRNAVLSLNFKY
ncbi:TonB-dependent receptor [Acinetobacter schindleri]|uniref:TonB-dependent siderophore receptor n=1 Tax=Acinetobacter schindleri CIP 107287 TaxID=1217988 RepID=N9AMZ1_9GAMM|nr:TonB-dependent siderophore receptor [Acinetobacter schindleri]ENV45398.1 hypothetical protein F955_00390 [Acinetobacter schindleri CIP 107287]MDP1445643.1 TonB-dependent siderophore receptor [Acinetobacter schindleri]